jgi:hypothetical protein
MGVTEGEHLTTRGFAVGSFEFEVVTSTDEDRTLVEALFHDVPASTSPHGRTVFSVLRDGSGWTISSQNLGRVSVPRLESALNLLMGEVNLGALDADPGCLHLHAALAIHDGRAAVIAAERNTGKTTTVAHLVGRGWAFVTDETVRVSDRTTALSGFPKPLSIKPGGHEHVPHLVPSLIPPLGDGPDDFRFVAMGATGAAVVEGGLPHLVILLRRPPIGSTASRPVAQQLHPADAVVALMQETLDAERYGSAALRLAELTAGTHNYELITGTPTETTDAIEKLFRAEPTGRLAVSLLPPSDAFSRGVVSVAIGDRAVVHDTASGQIFALDAGATLVWRQLGGWDTEQQIDLQGPVIAPFVAQLEALGVLASTVP